MQKDVIYIDVEDDITAIIGKVKATKEKVVALVPPKRVGVLQSAVNLRLLLRAAKQDHKHLVLITNNQALIALAGSAQIPVAKNLQSKPEIPEITALKVDDDDDIIDGEQLPVGDHADSIRGAATVPDSALDDVSIDDDAPLKKAVPPTAGAMPARPRVKSGVKVPSFDRFRKKFIFIIAGVIALIAFLVWAIVFAPHATVVIDAQTAPQQIRTSVTLGSALATDATKGTLKSTTIQDKQPQAVEFVASGKQRVGEKAKGTMTITRIGVSSTPDTIPIGTGFSSGNYTFTTTAAATVPKSSIVGSGIEHGSTTVAVQAVDIGDGYNLGPQSYQSTMSGFSASGSQMSGGSAKDIQVVTQSDVMAATEQLAKQKSDDVKKKLADKFPSSSSVIDSSFIVAAGDTQSSPAIGQEAPGGKAKLTQETTYSLSAVDKNDLDNFLTKALQKTLTDTKEQRVYDTGVKSAQLTAFTQSDGAASAQATLSASGRVGPMIDEDAIKEQIKGKRFGEVQSSLKSINGIRDAQTKFSPFWVQSVPGDPKKVTIEFKLTDGK